MTYIIKILSFKARAHTLKSSAFSATAAHLPLLRPLWFVFRVFICRANYRELPKALIKAYTSKSHNKRTFVCFNVYSLFTGLWKLCEFCGGWLDPKAVMNFCLALNHYFALPAVDTLARAGNAPPSERLL